MSPERRDAPVPIHLEVTRTARVYALGPRPAPPGAELWVACHGYRQLAGRFIKRFVGLDNGHRSVVAPEGLSRFYLDEAGGSHGPDARIGATWMTREDREAEIADYVRYLDRVVDHWTARTATACEWDAPAASSSSGVVASGGAVATGGVVALGFSQGCHTVARWVALGRTRVKRLILWGAYLPVDPEPATYADRLADVDVVVVRGADDPYVSEAFHDRHLARMQRAGIANTVVVHPGGHRLDGTVLAKLAS